MYGFCTDRKGQFCRRSIHLSLKFGHERGVMLLRRADALVPRQQPDRAQGFAIPQQRHRERIAEPARVPVLHLGQLASSKITIPTPGTPVALASIPAKTVKVRVEAVGTNGGKLYLHCSTGVITALPSGEVMRWRRIATVNCCAPISIRWMRMTRTTAVLI